MNSLTRKLRESPWNDVEGVSRKLFEPQLNSFPADQCKAKEHRI
jgi:hypothetical protein